MKPVLQSLQARADIDDALDFHALEAPQITDGFLDAREKAGAHIQRAPGTGAPGYAQELGLSGLRFWGLNKFAFSLFYIEQADHLWVIRLVQMSRWLRTSRDILASLRD